MFTQRLHLILTTYPPDRMAALIDHVNALQVEIVNLEFQKEIHLHSMYQEDLLQVRDEITAREAQIAGLRGRLNQLISALPETERLALASATQEVCTKKILYTLLNFGDKAS
jgi:hypothetical protein